MKMMKAVKKLKFWSRKKKKKKQQHFMEHHPIPPPCQCHCHCYCPYPPLEPSAPPLPTWLDTQQSQDAIFAAEACGSSSETDELIQQEIVLSESEAPLPALLPITSYQQYMSSNPVNGIPVAAAARERNAGVFGCVVDIGIHLIACFCPCYPIREVHYH